MTIHDPAVSPKAEAKSPVAAAAAAGAAKKKKVSSKKPKGLGQSIRKKKKKRADSYATFVHRVLKQVHPEAGISRKAMVVMDDMVKHLFERIATEAKHLQAIQKRPTFTPKDVQAAVALVLPGELASHSFSEGNKALTLFLSNTQKPKKPKEE